MAEREIADLLREVRRIRLVALRQVDDFLAGEYLSVFKGRGMEFDEVREYSPGDDVRTIDWNVTARAGRPYVKRFCEERELTVITAMDVSASGAFGSLRLSKLETATETAAALMFSALKNNDKVGLLLFAGRTRRYFPPRKGRGHVLRLLRELLAVEPVREEADLPAALEFLGRVQRRRAVVFLLSDFMGPDCTREAAVAGKRHDLIAVTLSDPRESSLPEVGFLTLRDAETDETVEVDTRHAKVRQLFSSRAAAREKTLADTLRRADVERIAVRAGEPCGPELRRFFLQRARRGR